MSEVSIARKLEYRKFSPEAEKFQDLKVALRAVKDVQNSDNPEIVDLMMNVWGKINENNIKLKKKYQALGKFKELDSTELWHIVVDSSPGWDCELDVKGEDSIRLFLINLLPESNKKRKELGLPEIKLAELGIGPEDLADLDLPESKMSEIEKLF